MSASRRLRWVIRFTILVLMWFGATAVAADTTVRVAALQFGTVNWELNTIRHHGFDKTEGIRIEIYPVGSKRAAAVALRAGAVDIIVNDWIWVSRQRHAGKMVTFYPWSMASGAVLVRPDAGIASLRDLGGRRIGVAGGPVDKSWLLLRTLYRARSGDDLSETAQPVFAAPPLLNELMLRGNLPAVVNYWHYAARLSADGMRTLMPVEDMLAALGIEHRVPMIGWVFSEQWARANPEAVSAFLRASAAAKDLLARSEGEWQRIRPLTKAKNERMLMALKDAFRAGIPRSFGRREIEAARELFAILAREGGRELTGGASNLAAGTFWLPPKRRGPQWP